MVKDLDNIRLVIFSALIGTCLSNFSVDPEKTASAVLASIFIFVVIIVAFFANMIPVHKNSGWSRATKISTIVVLAFTMMIGVFAMIPSEKFDIYSYLNENIGLDRSKIFLIQLTLWIWYTTSQLMLAIRHYFSTTDNP
jgi:membrane protein YdbS with pleckstrin-like domain